MAGWAGPNNGLGNLLKQIYFDTPATSVLSAPPQTVRGRIQDGLASVLEKVGYTPRHAQSFAGKATGFVNDVTPVGSAISADDAGSDWRKGDYAGAVGNGLASLLGLIPDGGAVAGKGLGALHAIIAPLWHGSPHKFEKFALDKIGTGEGAQAYGHGLYFAENKNVAQDYRDKLSFNPMQTPADLAKSVLDTMGGDRDAALEELNHRINAYLNTPAKYRTPDGYDRFMAAKQAIHGQKESQVGGHLYQVKLDANPEDFLDFDAPLSGQPEPVRATLANKFGMTRDPADIEAQMAALNQRKMELAKVRDPITNRISDEQQWHDLSRQVVALNGQLFPIQSGAHIYGGIAAPKDASAALNQAGIPGLRYLDQGSRGASGSPTRNYVVFDPSIIDILARH